MLTIKDFLKLQKMISNALDEKLKQFYEDHIRHLPTKDEYFTRMDDIAGRLKKIDETQELHQGQHDVINDRLDHLEQPTQTA